MTGSDPIVIVAARSVTAALGSTLTLICALPDPDAGFTLIHVAGDPTVHAHAACVRISIVALSPAAFSGAPGPDTLYSHGAPSWLTSARTSPMRIAPRRVTGSALALTR